MANEVKITISIDTEGKASIAYDAPGTPSPVVMGPLDPDALRDLAARAPIVVDEVPGPVTPTEMLISPPPEADIVPKFHAMEKLPVLSQISAEVVPGPSMLEEFTPRSDLTTEYPQMEKPEFMMVPTITAEAHEPPHLKDPGITASDLDDIPEPMSPEELSAQNNDD